MIRIAHVSDLHILALAGNSPLKFLGKRLTGLANLKFKRAHAHRPGLVQKILAELKRLDPDHVVVTGDLTNLALESEFRAVRAVLDEHLGMNPKRVSVIPGNHDAYAKDAAKKDHFRNYFGAYMTSDDAGENAAAKFPFARKVTSRETAEGAKAKGVTVIGLSTAITTAPLRSAGRVGKAQLFELQGKLESPALADQTVVLLAHHPIVNPKSRLKQFSGGLLDQPELAKILKERRALTLSLHGHLHHRMIRSLEGGHESIIAIGATSASLDTHDMERRAGYNWYEFTDDGKLLHSSSQAVTLDEKGFQEVPLPLK
jgi:3',5'-cyclic AMP phosphodiesterase CpdA